MRGVFGMGSQLIYQYETRLEPGEVFVLLTEHHKVVFSIVDGEVRFGFRFFQIGESTYNKDLVPGPGCEDFVRRIRPYDRVDVLGMEVRVTPGDPGSAVLRAAQRGRKSFRTRFRVNEPDISCDGIHEW